MRGGFAGASCRFDFNLKTTRTAWIKYPSSRNCGLINNNLNTTDYIRILFAILLAMTAAVLVAWSSLRVTSSNYTFIVFNSFWKTENQHAPVINAHCKVMFQRTEQKAIWVRENENFPSASPFSNLLSENTTANFYISIRTEGRLGNNLFQLAALLGIAMRHNRTPVLLNDDLRLIDRYFINLPVVRSSEIINGKQTNFTIVYGGKPALFNNYTVSLPSANVTLAKSVHSRLYFLQHENAMRQTLVFNNAVLAKARAFINRTSPNQWKGQIFTRVAIHIRRTDFFTRYSEKLITYINTSTPGYIRRSMDYFRGCYDRVQFIVISDDIEWCKQNLFGSNIVYSEGHSPGEDLALCSLCDHAIITMGSFGVWAAWFVNGVTVRPPLNVTHSYTTQLLEQEYYFPNGTVEQ